MDEYPLKNPPPEDATPPVQRWRLSDLPAGDDDMPRAQPRHETPPIEWYRGNIVLAAVPLAVVVALNYGFIQCARHDNLFALLIALFAPVSALAFNAVLVILLSLLNPWVREITGWSAKLHVWVAIVSGILASVIDVLILWRWFGA